MSRGIERISLLDDGDGNRVAKTASGVVTTTKFMVDEMNPTGYAQVLNEMTNGSARRIYVHGRMLVGQTQLLDGHWTASLYGLDGQGSVWFLMESSGATVATWARPVNDRSQSISMDD